MESRDHRPWIALAGTSVACAAIVVTLVLAAQTDPKAGLWTKVWFLLLLIPFTFLTASGLYLTGAALFAWPPFRRGQDPSPRDLPRIGVHTADGGWTGLVEPKIRNQDKAIVTEGKGSRTIAERPDIS